RRAALLPDLHAEAAALLVGSRAALHPRIPAYLDVGGRRAVLSHLARLGLSPGPEVALTPRRQPGGGGRGGSLSGNESLAAPDPLRWARARRAAGPHPAESGRGGAGFLDGFARIPRGDRGGCELPRLESRVAPVPQCRPIGYCANPVAPNPARPLHQ